MLFFKLQMLVFNSFTLVHMGQVRETALERQCFEIRLKFVSTLPEEQFKNCADLYLSARRSWKIDWKRNFFSFSLFEVNAC